MIPASANATQTAAPAIAPADPRSEKIPAPTIDPTPMDAASRVLTYRRSFGGAWVPSPDSPAIGDMLVVGMRLDSPDWDEGLRRPCNVRQHETARMLTVS